MNAIVSCNVEQMLTLFCVTSFNSKKTYLKLLWQWRPGGGGRFFIKHRVLFVEWLSIRILFEYFRGEYSNPIFPNESQPYCDGCHLATMLAQSTLKCSPVVSVYRQFHFHVSLTQLQMISFHWNFEITKLCQFEICLTHLLNIRTEYLNGYMVNFIWLSSDLMMLILAVSVICCK